MLSIIKRENRIPSLFDDVFGNHNSFFTDVFAQNEFLTDPSPDIDIIDKVDKIVLKADLPGLSKDDIKVTMDRGVLTITGERKQETKEEKDGVLRQEVCYGSFSRSFDLNYDVANQDD